MNVEGKWGYFVFGILLCFVLITIYSLAYATGYVQGIQVAGLLKDVCGG